MSALPSADAVAAVPSVVLTGVPTLSVYRRPATTPAAVAVSPATLLLESVETESKLMFPGVSAREHLKLICVLGVGVVAVPKAVYVPNDRAVGDALLVTQVGVKAVVTLKFWLTGAAWEGVAAPMAAAIARAVTMRNFTRFLQKLLRRSKFKLENFFKMPHQVVLQIITIVTIKSVKDQLFKRGRFQAK